MCGKFTRALLSHQIFFIREREKIEREEKGTIVFVVEFFYFQMFSQRKMA
jgi:hypothetical protein